MATYNEMLAYTPTLQSQLNTQMLSAFLERGITSSIRIGLTSTIIAITSNRYGNIDTIFPKESTTIVQRYTQIIQSIVIPDFLKQVNFAPGQKDVKSKTGTESDAGSFDNDPTTDDEFRSYPFDTTASDVQSKTRSIVNGAESGTTSNTKTYNTTDTFTNNDNSPETQSKLESLVFDFAFEFVRRIYDTIRTSFTLCNPLSDDSTLLEIEF